MDSTMLYQLVLEQLHTGQELVNLLPQLSSLLIPQSKLATNHMNDQQIFAQIHKSVTKALLAQQAETQQLLANLQQPSEAEQEFSEEEEGQQYQEEGQNDWEADSLEEQDQELQEEVDFEQEGQQGDPFEQIDEEENQDEMDEEDALGQEEAFQGQEDVGLYGEEIDQQDMESYQNQGDSEQERQFQAEQKNLSKGKRRNYTNHDQDEEDQGQDLINDQFDHFREVQLQNKQQPQTSEQKTQLQKQIQKLQDKIISKKDWVLRGEVKATQRPVNSLLQYDLQFNTGIRLDQQITAEVNSEIQTMIKQRILDELYDDRVRYQHSHVLREQYSTLKEVSTQKSKLGLGQLYQAEFKNYLGLGENKNDKLKKQILQSFKEVNFYLDSLSNFNFTPRPSTGTKNEVVISEEKVPISMWKGNQEQPTANIERKIVSQKEQNNKAKRIKNKRIARQRKKQQDRKKLNKKIEYGGMTKFEAKAMAQKAKNNLNKDNVKYNKSTNFFAEMNKEKKGKPNPHIGKLKI